MNETAAPAEAPPSLGARVHGRLQRWRKQLMIGVPVVAIALFAFIFLTHGRWQETDNAYVQAARVPISASIAGRIVELRVHENERVERGQVLFVLDQANYQAQVAELEAALAATQLRVRSLRAEHRARVAAVRGAGTTLEFAHREARRARALAEGGAASQQDYAAARHAEEEAQVALVTARQAQDAALAALGGNANVSVDAHPLVREAAARLERARLGLSYTEVLAPQAGIVTRVDQVQIGSYVNQGGTLFWLLAGAPWIEANFKENQLARMRVGQTAEVRLDLYPNLRLNARVASFSPGTGAVFAVLPAQNATGNWVKVVQRVPVRLTLIDPPERVMLTAGTSARVRVDTKSTSDELRGR